MHEKMEKLEDIEPITMYKMIQALYKYDYYSTKCLVNVFLQKRTGEREIKNLRQIQDMIFYQKDKQLEEFLIELIKEEETR